MLEFLLSLFGPKPDAEAACSSYQYQCVTTSECVYEIDLCDGRSNCADGSDEAREFCNVSPFHVHF